jgi:hypothetical protein
MADDSITDPFIGIALFPEDSFTTPAFPTGASGASNASTVNAGLLDFIRREIALQAAQQMLPAVFRPMTTTERNRSLAQQHLRPHRQKNDNSYVLPLDALLTDSALQQFRQLQRDPMNFSAVVWSDTIWTFPPGHVDVLSDNAAAASAYAALVGQFPVAFEVSTPSTAATLQKRADAAAYPPPTILPVMSPLDFHDMMALLKTAWTSGRLFSLIDVLDTRLVLMFNMIDKAKYPSVNLASTDQAYQIGWVLHTQLLALMVRWYQTRK